MSKKALEITQRNLQQMNRVVFDYVVFHSPCNDGHAAAAVIRKHTPTITPIGLRNGEVLLTEQSKILFKDKHVVMVDICVTPSEMDHLSSSAASVLVLDHHVTNQQAYQDKHWENVTLHFEMDTPGCWLAWNYFYGTQIPLPAALYYIGLRDIWKHERFPEAVNFNAAFECPKSWDAWDPYLLNITCVIQSLIIKGSVINEYRASLIATMCEKTEYVTWRGYHVAVINAPYPFVSDIGHVLCSPPNTIAVIWNKSLNDMYNYSLRSCGDIDVAVIAAEFQGGGHKNAAGFRSMKQANEIFY